MKPTLVNHSADPLARTPDRELDVAIIGSGVSGMYALHRMRELGLAARAYDRAGEVGGTWWWNRYPGARVDYPGGPYYCYTFSEELVRGWDWEETQPDQPAVLGYLNYVADQLDLRRDIQLSTSIVSARFDEVEQRWRLRTDTDEEIAARFLISAVGTLSAPNTPAIAGLEEFEGEVYHTGMWPQDREVDFSGKRVGVVGTGSSGVQIIPHIAEKAGHLTVFQRTPQYALPVRNRPLDPDFTAENKKNWSEIRRQIREYGRPLAMRPSTRSAHEDTAEERAAVFEAAWEQGAMALRECYGDLLTDETSNGWAADFVRSKIGEIVDDPEVAAKLLPDYLFATKRQILVDDYYETFNRPNVGLVDLREEPIERITPTGVRTEAGEYDLDILVLATGYDAITGALSTLNPVGRDGVQLGRRWAETNANYLGMTVAGFPNMFIVHGPGSPSAVFHMFYGSESIVEWIANCITSMAEAGYATVEALPEAEPGWKAEVQAIADKTLYPRTPSWYTGANIPGKPREFLVYLNGTQYHKKIHDVAAGGYDGFVFG